MFGDHPSDDPGPSTKQKQKNANDGERFRGDTKGTTTKDSMPTFDPEDLIDRTFLKLPEENGERFRAKIIDAIRDRDGKIATDPAFIKFRCSVNDDEYEEIVAYNDILNHLEEDREAEGVWKFRKILKHMGPLTQRDKAWKGHMYNVQIEWETGEITWEPLNLIAKSDPVSRATYASENGLLDTPRWKQFRRLAR